MGFQEGMAVLKLTHGIFDDNIKLIIIRIGRDILSNSKRKVCMVSMKKCAVIGSINMDMVTSVDQFPKPGETRMGRSFATVPGGKGANQAIALGRLGTPTAMAGKVGDDLFGKQYLTHFEKTGVDASAVFVSNHSGTGTATIEVNGEGENHIIVVAGANGECDGPWMEQVLSKLSAYDIFLLQLEIPLATVFECIRRLKAMGKTIILDPAPAAPIPDDVLGSVDVITPNETELRIVTASLPESAGTQERIQHLLNLNVRMVVHKCGAGGAYIATKDGTEHIPGFKVKAVDTTAAGDTFNAGFATGLAQGLSLQEAVRLGNAAAALSVTAFGAQDGMPSMERVQAFLAEQ